MTPQKKVEQIRVRLQRLEEANKGILTPQAVVADARNPKSPLHAFFDWDKDRCVDRDLLEQARTLIKTVYVTIKQAGGEETKVPAWVRHPDVEAKEQGYISTKRMADDKDTERSRQVIRYEIMQAEARMRRVTELAVALGIVQEAEYILSGIRLLAQHPTIRGDGGSQPSAPH